VGTRKPNDWGIHDGHGSVSEWCSDYFGSRYPAGSLTDPVGSAGGWYRMMRGGSWGVEAKLCRSAVKNYGEPNLGRSHVGFRVVLISSGIPKSPEPK
jgi:formylglycine-generating enzyme required for sulfatase activity